MICTVVNNQIRATISGWGCDPIQATRSFSCECERGRHGATQTGGGAEEGAASSKAALCLGDCYSAIDLTKLQIPSQDPLSLLHLAKAGILIPAIIKLLTNSTYVSVSSGP